MSSSNICWGIEIGYGAIKALKLQADGNELTVLDFAVIPHPKVLSTPEIDKDDALRVTLGTLASRYDLTGATIAISIPGHQSFARFAKLPPVEPKKVPDIVKFEAVQQIPFPLEEVEWDYQTFASEDSPEVEVGIFAVTTKRINDLLTMLGDVGVTPDLATLSPIAAYNALAYDLQFTEKTPGTILLDIGSVATDLIIADAGRVWVRTFPIGGHQFTEALVNTFKLSYSKAEKLKKEAEQTKHARHVFQAMRPVFGDLVQEVQRSIGYYQSIHPEAELERLIGLGSTFKLPGLRKYLKQQLQLDVYRMEQFKRLSVDGPQAGEFQSSSLNMATAYGLAAQALDKGTLQANLMPVSVVREAMWKRKTPWFAAAAGLAAAAAGSMFIRPLMDNTALTGAETPPVIGQVVRDAGREAQRAEEAGVTGSGEADLRADKIVKLFEGREVYARVLNDASLMVAESNRIAAENPQIETPEGEPAFTLVNLDASFVSDDTAVTSAAGYDPGAYGEFGGEGAYSRGGGGGYGRVAPTPSRQPQAQAKDDPLDQIKDKRRIRVQMELETGSENIYIMDDTIMAWLNDHIGEREGAPYTIFIGDQPWVQGASIAAVTPQGGPTTRPTRGGGVRPPRGGPGQVFGGESGAAPAYNPRGGGTGATRVPELSQLAPIDPPSVQEPSGERQRYVVTWFAVLDPIEQTQEDDS
ncbi:MAG: type IV pilus assembly protein PilM [Phycisphaerales bacterium JB059]